MLTEVGADAWAFQECTGWRAAGGHGFFTAERILGMRGFGVPSSHHGCDLAVFVRESAGLRVIAERHEQGRPYWHAVAGVVVATPWPGSSLHLVSTHLAPSPSIRLSEAETLALMAKDGWVIAGGDWHALSATDPEPPLDGIDRAEARAHWTALPPSRSRKPGSQTSGRTLKIFGRRSGTPAGFAIAVTGCTRRCRQQSS